MRASVACISSTGDTCRLATARASSVAVWKANSVLMGPFVPVSRPATVLWLPPAECPQKPCAAPEIGSDRSSIHIRYRKYIS